jgi:hypothetical protein
MVLDISQNRGLDLVSPYITKSDPLFGTPPPTGAYLAHVCKRYLELHFLWKYNGTYKRFLHIQCSAFTNLNESHGSTILFQAMLL